MRQNRRSHFYVVALAVLALVGGCESTTSSSGGTASAPTFSPAGGTYASAQTISITTTTDGASIRYTTDGTTPTSAVGTLYSAPVSVSATTTIKAIAYHSGWTDSSVGSANYAITGAWHSFGPFTSDWLQTAISSDGSHLAIAFNAQNIYTSSDGGTTWVERAAPGGPQKWWSIASSSDGSCLAACAGGWQNYGDIYTSSDGGATWTDQTAAGTRGWRSIVSSSDGKKLAACVCPNGTDPFQSIYTSTDGGVTWTERTAAGQKAWVAIASSADGNRLAACAFGDAGSTQGGYICTSTDGGATWTSQTASGRRYWQQDALCMSSDGTRLAACVGFGGSSQSGDIYASNDGGVTWTDQTTAGTRAWNCLAMSSDGNHLIAGVATDTSPGDVFTSDDGGTTWVDRTALGQHYWDSVMLSSDGSRVSAAWGCSIWTGQF